MQQNRLSREHYAAQSNQRVGLLFGSVFAWLFGCSVGEGGIIGGWGSLLCFPVDFFFIVKLEHSFVHSLRSFTQSYARRVRSSLSSLLEFHF